MTALPRSPSALAVLVGAPFLFCFIAGQIGGWAGGSVFAFLLLLLLWLPYMSIATGAPAGQWLPSFVPAAAGLLGFASGSALPELLKV